MLVDESNVGSSVRTAGRGLDWLKLRDFLAGPNTGRDLIEMVVYAGLPPAIPTWQEERDRKNKFVHWLRSNGFMVVTKDGAPAEEGHYKANVDVSIWPRCFGRSRSNKFRMRQSRYHSDRSSSSNNSGDARLGFVPLLHRDKQPKVEAYGTQPRQR